MFKQQHQENAGKSTSIDILEFLKLQNILWPQTWLGKS